MIGRIDICNTQINEVVKLLLDKKVRAKLILNFDGNGKVIPELVLNNEALFKIVLSQKKEI